MKLYFLVTIYLDYVPSVTSAHVQFGFLLVSSVCTKNGFRNSSIAFVLKANEIKEDLLLIKQKSCFVN